MNRRWVPPDDPMDIEVDELDDSIIKHLTKQKYNIESKEYRFFNEKENKYLRTQKYIFTKLI
jgi:hypothetical protein